MFTMDRINSFWVGALMKILRNNKEIIKNLKNCYFLQLRELR